MCEEWLNLVAIDVYKAVGYDRENGEKVIQSLVPMNYKLRFGDVDISPKGGEEIFPHSTKHGFFLKKRVSIHFCYACKKPRLVN